MKILQVVTHISDDGSFGGPARVAEAQCEALGELGHEVTLLSTSNIRKSRIEVRPNYTMVLVPAKRLHPRLGFAGMYGRGLILQLLRRVPESDVVHIHLARDLVTLPAGVMSAMANVPFLVQTHGMIDESQRFLAKPIDRLLTKPLLQKANRVLTITEMEDNDILSVQKTARLLRISNGIRKLTSTHTTKPDRRIVLFLARLHPRKRAVAFVEMAAILKTKFSDLKFVIAGPDEGNLEEVLQTIQALAIQDAVEVIGPVNPSETDSLLGEASVFVLPSFGEIFPMTLLEAFQVGTPSVVTSSLGIVGDCIDFNAAAVTDGSPEDLAAAVSRILEDDDYRTQLVTGSLGYLQEKLDIMKVAADLEMAYGQAI